MKVLVTGGSGYLGTHIRSFFSADDLSRRSGLDILNINDAGMAEDYDMVIHLAANLDKSPDGQHHTFQTNVEGTVNLLRSVKRDAVFIYASTKDVYGRFADKYDTVSETCETLYAGQSPLEWSKLIAERYVEYYAAQRGFRSCILRMSTVYAPMSEGNTSGFVGYYADAINKGEKIKLPGGGAPIRDILHVDDLAAACQAFADSVIRNGLYNIGGGRNNALSLRDLVAKMEEVSGFQAVIDEEAEIPAPPPLKYISDISLIDQEIDWTPKVGLADGLKTLFR